MNETTVADQVVYSLLIPLSGERLIVPRACVAEVVSLNEPVERPDAAPWLTGNMNWNGRLIPLVSFEGACGRPLPDVGNRTRVVVFFGVAGVLREGHFGVLTQGFPQLVRVSQEVLVAETDKGWSPDSPIISRVRMINEYPLIPDLERLEQLIAAELGYLETTA